MAKKLDINLQKLPTPAKIGIIAGVVLIIIALSYFLLYKPKLKEIKQLEVTISNQQKEIAKNEAKVAKLPELKKLYAELDASLKILSAQLPEEKEVSNLLKQVSDYGTNSGLNFTYWKPGAKKMHQSGIVYVVPVDMKMEGTYHSLGEFFSKLSGMNRIINFNSIALKSAKAKDGVGRLEMSLIGETYSAVPEDEIKKGAAKPGPKGRRGRR